MRIALFHGYELTGSGSNEYTRYLSRALAEMGHEVHVLCRESSPDAIEHVSKAMDWARLSLISHGCSSNGRRADRARCTSFRMHRCNRST